MRKQEHTLTLRLPKETAARLRKAARANHCSVSDIVRDILSVGVPEEPHEHAFFCKESWSRAVKSRDRSRCVCCGSSQDIEAYIIVSPENGNGIMLSNGITLCFECYKAQYAHESFSENGHSIYDTLPKSWKRKYNHAKEKGRIFWERHLACFLTQRKRSLSPIVEWYAETFLRDVPEEVIIRTLIELCPSPDIIAGFPGRRYTSPNETFKPPPLLWNDKRHGM